MWVTILLLPGSSCQQSQGYSSQAPSKTPNETPSETPYDALSEKSSEALSETFSEALSESQDHYKMIFRVYVNGELYKKVNPMVDTCIVLDLQVY